MSRGDKGKKIDTWTLSAEGRTTSVIVYLFHAYGGQRFRAVCAEYDCSEEHSDINALKKLIAEKVTPLMNVVWTRKIHVTVHAPRVQADARQKDRGATGEPGWEINAALKFEAEVYELQIGSKHIRLLGDAHISQYELRVGDDAHARQYHGGKPEGTTQALIDDTPENRAALLRINDGMEELGRRLRALLAPTRIEATLHHVLSVEGSRAPLGLPESTKPEIPTRKRKR